MSENKQTAVEWLISQIIDGEIDPATNAVFLKKHINKIEVFEQAKAMERKQIEEAYNDAKLDSSLYANCLEPYHNDASDYFTKTYQNGKEI